METGLYYNRFRYYSPDEGIYLSQDPIGLNGGKELYGYVNNVNMEVDVWGFSEMARLVLAGNASSPSGLRMGKDINLDQDGIIKSQVDVEGRRRICI